MRRTLFVIIVLLGMRILSAQVNLPEPNEIYRLIHDSSKSHAGDVYWAEIYQRNDGIALQWVMHEVERVGQTFESTCYRALFVGEGTPIYTINDEPINLETAEELRESFEGRNLIVNSERFVMEDVECTNETQTATINGYEANLCQFSGIDTMSIFRTKGTAQAEGELWTATDGGFPIRYTFEAEGTSNGSNNIVRHTYELLPAQNIEIVFPTEVRLQCFDEGFPDLADTYITSNSLNYIAALSDLSPDDLWTELDIALLNIGWIINTEISEQDQRYYDLDLTDGNTCRLRVQVRGNTGRTQIGVTVSPQINIETVALPEGWESPVVVQGADFSTRYAGTVREAAVAYIEIENARGWYLREDLTDIREESAFLVITDGIQEQYVTIDAAGTVAILRIQFTDVCSLE